MTKLNEISRLFRKTPKTVFTNVYYQQLETNYDNFFDINDSCIDFNAPLLNQIQRVSFELSNSCNYSIFHKKCPASRVSIKKTLPITIIQKVLTELSVINYGGVVAFHRYNEPLIDPRLFYLINLTKELCPNAKILILTNGFYLTEQLASDIAHLGTWVLAVSSYSKEEFARLSSIDIKIPYLVFNSILDDREDIYSKEPLDLKVGCLAPLRDLTISVDGKIVLCCLDWQNKHEFGDVSKNKLSDIINSYDFRKTASELSNKTRHLDLCRRCSMVR